MADPNYAEAVRAQINGRGVPEAQANLSGVQDINPEQAAKGIAAGKGLGLDPVASMALPGELQRQAQSTANDKILGNNPVLSQFVAKDSAHAAVTQDDFRNLDSVSRAIAKWTIPGQSAWGGYSPLESLDEPAAQAAEALSHAEDVRREQQEALDSGDFGRVLELGEQRVGTAASVAFAPFQSLLHLAGDPFGRAIASIPGSNKFPFGTVTPQEAAQRYSQLGETIATLGTANLFKAEPFRPINGEGNPTVNNLGDHPVNPEGFMVDREGAPYVFRDKYDAALWAKSHLKETGQDWEVGVHEETGLAGLRLKPEAVEEEAAPSEEKPKALEEGLPEANPPKGEELDDVIREHDQNALEELSTVVDESKLLQRSPSMMEEYLADHGLRDATVYVEPQKLLELHQSDPEAAEVINDLMTRVPGLEGAYSSGQPWPVPLSEWLTSTAGKSWEQEAMKMVSLHPDVSAEPSTPGKILYLGQTVGPIEQEKQIGKSNLPSPLQARVTNAVGRIAQARGLDKIFSEPAAAGVSKPKYERYAERTQKALDELNQRALAKLERYMKGDAKTKYTEALARHLPVVSQETENSPTVQAVQSMRYSDNPLYKIASSEKKAYKGLKDLPAVYFSKNGLTMQQITDRVGAPSAEELIDGIIRLEKAKGRKAFNTWKKEEVNNLANERALGEVGDITHPDDIAQAVQEAFREKPVEDLLIDQLKELAKRLNRKIEPGDVQGEAIRLTQAKPIKEATNIKAIEAGMKKSADAMEEALQKNKYIEAFNAKQAQLISHYQLKLAHDLRQDVNQGLRLMRSLGKTAAIGRLDPNVAAVIQQALKDIRMPTSRDNDELQRFLAQGKWQTPEALSQEMIQNGVPNISTKPEPQALAHNGAVWPWMTVRGFLDYTDMLKGFAAFGKALNELSSAKGTADFNASVQEMERNAFAIGRKYSAQELVDYRSTWWKEQASNIKTFFINNLRPEIFLRFLDSGGHGYGPMQQFLIDPLMEGKYKETDLVNQFREISKEHSSTIGRLGNKITAPKSMQVWTKVGNETQPVTVISERGDVFRAALHLGSDVARRKLLDGFGWGEEQEKWITDQIRPEEWKLINDFYKFNEQLFGMADKMYMGLRGYGLKKDTPRPFGRSEGGHLHIEYDTVLKPMITNPPEEGASSLVSGPQATASVGNLMDPHFASALPSAYYGIERTGYTGPVSLDWTRLGPGIGEVIHDIAFRPSLAQAQKLVTDPRIQNVINSVLGPDYMKQLIPWLRYIAQERMIYDPATDAAAKAIRGLTNNIVWAKIAYNLSSTTKHSLVGISHIATEIGNPAELGKAALDLTGIGPKSQAWRQFVYDNIPEARNAIWNLDPSVRDILSSEGWNKNAVQVYRDTGFAFMAMSRAIEAQWIGLAAYRVSMGKYGDHDIAVSRANRAIRDTQGASSVVDQPPLLRATHTWYGELGRMVAGTMMGFRSTGPNRTWTAVRTLGLGARQIAGESPGGVGAGASNVGRATAGMLGFVIFSSMLLGLYGALVRGDEPKGEEDKSPMQRWADETAWGLGENTLGSVIGGNVIFDYAHYGSDSASGLLGDLSKETDKMMTSKNHETATINGLRLFGDSTGLLPNSAVNLGRAFYDQQNPDQLMEGEQTVPSFLQRGLLGRSPRTYQQRSRRR